MSDLSFRSACELTNLIRKREISSRELLEHYPARIEEFNPKLNAVVTIDADRARKRADAADQALARGESWGPLHGLPITVKDTFETAGVCTTAGAREFSEYVPITDAIAVARLQAAGAVLMGKTNTPVPNVSQPRVHTSRETSKALENNFARLEEMRWNMDFSLSISNPRESATSHKQSKVWVMT